MGGRDNITAVLFRIGGGDEKPASGETLEDTKTDLDSRAVLEAAGPAAATQEAPRRRRRRLRVAAITAIVLVVLAAGTVGAVAGLRHVYFIGQDDRGLVTLYRGLPYELPAGIKLYSKKYVSSVQLRRLRPFERRRLVNHKLRSHNEAARVIRDLERR
jgi:protein phosphatase